LRASVGLLTGQVWWAHGEPPRVAAILRELQESGLVVLYTVRNQQYLHVKGWAKHQRVDNAGKNIVPPPSDPDCIVLGELAAIRGEPPRLAAGLGSGIRDPDPDREGEEEGSARGTKAGAAAPGPAPRARSPRPKKALPDLSPDEARVVAGVLDKLSRESGVE